MLYAIQTTFSPTQRPLFNMLTVCVPVFRYNKDLSLVIGYNVASDASWVSAYGTLCVVSRCVKMVIGCDGVSWIPVNVEKLWNVDVSGGRLGDPAMLSLEKKWMERGDMSSEEIATLIPSYASVANPGLEMFEMSVRGMLNRQAQRCVRHGEDAMFSATHANVIGRAVKVRICRACIKSDGVFSTWQEPHTKLIVVDGRFASFLATRGRWWSDPFELESL